MRSSVQTIGAIDLPTVNGEFPLMSFDLETLEGLADDYADIASQMLKGLPCITGTAYLTVHGKRLKAGGTLRRGGAHTDQNYDPIAMGWCGGGSWKTALCGSQTHVTGGLIMASSHASCLGWVGEYDGTPGVGGDCTHIDLGEPFELAAGTVYYGNNHFIHESLPVPMDCHRVLARITLPEDHTYLG